MGDEEGVMSDDGQDFADLVELAVKTALMPVLERLAVAESKVADVAGLEREVTGLRERLAVAETKAALMPPPAPDGAVLERLVALEGKSLAAPVVEPNAELARAVMELSKDFGALRERVAVVEVRPAVPGPQGEPGPPGRDGVDGKDGAAGLSFEGVYEEGQTYEKGHLVTWAGSSWHCNTPTTARPGEGSKDWTLMVKRGRDGKDGKDAEVRPVVRVS